MAMRIEESEGVLRFPVHAVRYPIELRTPPEFTPEDPTTWPRVDGRLEYVGGRLLYMPPSGDLQQDVVPAIAALLLEWAQAAGGFIVASNEAGMKLGGDVRGADVAVWKRDAARPHTGGYRRTAPVLAVEVAGIDEDVEALDEKAAWYLARGVAVVWLVMPDSREVVRVTDRGRTRHARGDVLPEHAALPGLAPPVARFFCQLDD